MNFKDYQSLSRKTALYMRKDMPNWLYPSLGLAGEVGEVVNKVKKIIRDDDGQVNEEKRAAIAKELGDVLWYVAQLATDLGLSLEEIATNNLKVIQTRLAQGQIHGSGDNREVLSLKPPKTQIKA